MSDIPYDMFDFMHAKGLHYGYQVAGIDDAEVRHLPHKIIIFVEQCAFPLICIQIYSCCAGTSHPFLFVPCQVTVGMWNFGAGYYKCNLTDAQKRVAESNGFLEKLPPPAARNSSFETFYNNFEIVGVPRFLQHDFRDFREAVEASHNIYRHR